jgi:GNAT superfamily N-acetyltransferase
MEPTYKIRNVKKDDVPGILEIALELGYPASENTVQDLIDLVLKNTDHNIILAEMDAKLLGYIHLHSVISESSQKTEVSGILIPDSHRKKGLGSRFLKEAEKWTRGRNLDTISIRTNLIRSEAIPFFKHHGFQHDSLHDAFIKRLT